MKRRGSLGLVPFSASYKIGLLSLRVWGSRGGFGGGGRGFGDFLSTLGTWQCRGFGIEGL